ncbi:hypothetical protein PR048_033341 [Dryococelus australis]|uniref:Uncharacterized protein n=1 Tax=Dryococelus australis TaxID=614101 RepID=A0ABQ9G016_9NEOP|nr:hypothetical protein PR048_033341 [Dryococelus australis]
MADVRRKYNILEFGLLVRNNAKNGVECISTYPFCEDGRGCCGSQPTHLSSRRTRFDYRRPRPGFPHVGIMPDDDADRWVFSGISSFSRPRSPALLHTPLASLSLALKTPMAMAVGAEAEPRPRLETNRQPPPATQSSLGIYFPRFVVVSARSAGPWGTRYYLKKRVALVLLLLLLLSALPDRTSFVGRDLLLFFRAPHAGCGLLSAAYRGRVGCPPPPTDHMRMRGGVCGRADWLQFTARFRFRTACFLYDYSFLPFSSARRCYLLAGGDNTVGFSRRNLQAVRYWSLVHSPALLWPCYSRHSRTTIPVTIANAYLHRELGELSTYLCKNLCVTNQNPCLVRSHAAVGAASVQCVRRCTRSHRLRNCVPIAVTICWKYTGGVSRYTGTIYFLYCALVSTGMLDGNSEFLVRTSQKKTGTLDEMEIHTWNLRSVTLCPKKQFYEVTYWTQNNCVVLYVISDRRFRNLGIFAYQDESIWKMARVPRNWLDSTVLCTLEPQMFVHCLVLLGLAGVTTHLAVWRSLLLSLQVCYLLRIVQDVSNELRSNCKDDFSIKAVPYWDTERVKRSWYANMSQCSPSDCKHPRVAQPLFSKLSGFRKPLLGSPFCPLRIRTGQANVNVNVLMDRKTNSNTPTGVCLRCAHVYFQIKYMCWANREKISGNTEKNTTAIGVVENIGSSLQRCSWFGWSATDLGCGRLWGRIPSKPSLVKPSSIKPGRRYKFLYITMQIVSYFNVFGRSKPQIKDGVLPIFVALPAHFPNNISRIAKTTVELNIDIT